ncbi:MAG: TldD/PmbA family protein, partial [Caldiserica bacterium]|nr:TldD/PmbA family protein [Caldisericota bacterium]
MSKGKEILQALEREQLEQVEVNTRRGWRKEVDIKNSEIHSYKEEEFNYHIIRAFKEKKKGMFNFETWKDNLAVYIREATLNSEPDPDFYSLPLPQKISPVEGLHSPSLEKLKGKDLLKIARGIIKKAKGVFPSVVLSGSLEVSCQEWEVVNSLGVEFRVPFTFLEISLEAIIWQKNGAGSFYDFEKSHRWEESLEEELPKRVVKRAKDYLNKKAVKTGFYPLILSPLSTYILLQTFAHSLNAEDVQKKRSFMGNKIGEKIAQDLFTLKDSGIIPGGMASSPCDGEGVPHREITVVEKGVLKTYFHNSYTAHKDGVSNTAHASIGGGISPTNLVLSRGERKFREIAGDLEEAIFADIISFSPHPVSGEFSVPLDLAYKIEKGEFTYPIKGAMAGGNFQEIIRQIKEISADFRPFPGNPAPYVL